MKGYTVGIIKDKCSAAMRKGRFVKVYENTFFKRCPNCRRRLKVKRL